MYASTMIAVARIGQRCWEKAEALPPNDTQENARAHTRTYTHTHTRKGEGHEPIMKLSMIKKTRKLNCAHFA
jgi:hypothetical protein